jgi:hypothetical protein
MSQTIRPNQNFVRLVRAAGKLAGEPINPIAVFKAQSLISANPNQNTVLPNSIKSHFSKFQSALTKGMQNANFRTMISKAGLSESYDAPQMLILRRTGIRIFPDGQKVALYSEDRTGLVFTVPFSSAGMVRSAIPGNNFVPENSILNAINLISEEIPIINIEYENGVLEIDTDLANEISEVYNSLNEENRLKFESLFVDFDSCLKLLDFINEARFKIVKARIRGGKVQRRRMVASTPGYTVRGGRVVRMSSSERMRRKIAQRKANVKRKAKSARALIKRKQSLRRRKSLGI